MGNKKNRKQFLPAINDGVSLLSQMKTQTIDKNNEKWLMY